MAIAPGIYNTGTATVASGGLTVSFQGVANLQAAIRPGDRFGGHVGFGIRIAAVGTDSVTLAHPWPGAAQTAAPYEIVFTPYDLSYREEFYEIIKRYGRGALPAMAELVGEDGAIPVFTGPQTMSLLTQQDITNGARYNVQVANLTERGNYNNEPVGFAVLVGDVGDGRAAIYSRVGPAGNWSAPAYITGPAITLDITEVDEVPYGTPPDATLTPKAGGYDLAFEIPRGMIIEPGTTTTLAPGQPAAVTFVPIAGGYRLDIALPKGDTGDIDGVTPYWVTRLSTDTDAAAARAGLGATSTGGALFTAADAPAARTEIGATPTGDALFTAVDEEAARTAIGATPIGDQLITAPTQSAGRTSLDAQQNLGWKPVSLVRPETNVSAIVIAVPAGSTHLRISGTIHQSNLLSLTYARVSIDGGATFVSTDDYTTSAGIIMQSGTITTHAGDTSSSIIVALEQGDAVLLSNVDIQFDFNDDLWLSVFTKQAAVDTQNRLTFLRGWYRGYGVTHIQLFGSSGQFTPNTSLLVEAF